ncbi:MAG: C39 family peptidase [Deltaproteobacteria bacterium]|nr:C39 family peptidase [Deltaproteobacteria bacterium]MBI4925598.1 C39 family peptidase [Bdellovibrio sp.]
MRKVRLLLMALTFFLALQSQGHFNILIPSLPKNYLQVPIIRQATDYSCGPASLLGVLNYWQVYEGAESELYSVLGTTEKNGTEPQKLLEGAKKYGLTADMKENLELADLKAALQKSETVILSYQAWRDEDSKDKPWSEIWEDGHYGVLVAMDSEFLYLMDPSYARGYVYVSQAEFLERWHDYEDREGKKWKYQHIAIFIHGEKPVSAFPGPIVVLE